MHVALVNVNDALFEASLGDDAAVLRELGERVRRLTVVVATARHRAPAMLAPNVHLVPVHAPDRARGLVAIGRALRAVHAVDPIDLVQAQEAMYTGLAARVARRALGAPLNVCVLGADPADPAFRATSLAHRAAATVGERILRGADGVQTDSRHVQAALASRGLPARYKPITPLNLDVFARAYARRTVREEGTRILFVGRLGRQKRLPLLLEAVAALPGARLTLVGDGPDRADLQALAARLGVDAEWRGQVAHTELPAVYLDADVLAMSSWYEGMPRAFMEAAATGLPIVSTPVAGAHELAAEAPVWLAPADPAGFAASLRAALADARGRRRSGEALHALMARRLADTPPPDQQLAVWDALLSGSTLASRAR